MSLDDNAIAPFRRARCPMCKRDEIEAFRPFCSKRCADSDLSQWLTGGYAVPAGDDDDPVLDGEDNLSA